MKFDKRLNQNCIVTFYEDLEVSMQAFTMQMMKL